MNARTWRFIALILAALTMGMHLAHALELPPKLQWEPGLYLAVQTSLYGLFGTLGPILEIGALISVAILAFLVRHRRPAFPYTLVSAIMIVFALILWAVVVMSANLQISQWQAPSAIPADWTRWRDQWQFGQATIFVLHLIGFSALVGSVVVETSTT